MECKINTVGLATTATLQPLYKSSLLLRTGRFCLNSFTVHMPLLMAIIAFRLAQRC